jgi:hypothetical protein
VTAGLDVRGLDVTALAEVYDAGDDDDRAAVLAEAERLDALAAAARRRRAWRASPAGQRYAAADAAWTDASHAEYLAADEACRGNLLSREAPARDV